jgi:hypothetical protein
MALAISILPVPARNASMLATRNGFAPTVAHALFTELLESSFFPSKDDRRPKEGQLHLESCRSDYDCAYRLLPGGHYVAALICGPSLNPWSRTVLLREVEHACTLIAKSDKLSPGDVEKRIIDVQSMVECVLYGTGNLSLACASADPKSALHSQSRIKMFPNGLPGEDASAWGAGVAAHKLSFDAAPFCPDTSFVPAAAAPILAAPLGSEFSDMVAAIAAAELEKSKSDSSTSAAPFSRTNSENFSDAFGAADGSASVGSIGGSAGQSKSAKNSLQSLSDMFGDSASLNSSPTSSKVSGTPKAADDKDWSDEEDDDQPKKKKFVIKIKDTVVNPASAAAPAFVPTISLPDAEALLL